MIKYWEMIELYDVCYKNSHRSYGQSSSSHYTVQVKECSSKRTTESRCYNGYMNIPTIIVLVGITGDLAKRKLLPALDSLKEKGMLPEHFKLVGITRRDDPELFNMDLDNAADYLRLKDHLQSIEKEWGTVAQRLFYLSVAPKVSLPIIKHLGDSGISSIEHTKLLLEKPFGLDDIDQYFSEEQVYRVDHYLAKESVRALSGRSIEESALERIEVSASEQIGIEGRADFYEQTGALRDFIQSHLLEVAATMVSPNNRLQALQQFYIPTDKPITEYVHRGQYIGYREAVGHPDSAVETKVSVTLYSHDSFLKNVSIVLKTGKALDHKSTDISVFYNDGAFEIISLDDMYHVYETVFADAIAGKKEFFISKAEVIETHRIIGSIQQAWKANSEDLAFYEQGSTL